MTMPLKTVFYTIEKTIKEYRKFSQRNLIKIEKHITVDQALVLNILKEQPGLSQKEIAGLLYKDVAAMTRMIEGMVKKGMLKKLPYPEDKRRSLIQPTDKGEAILEKIIPVVLKNRKLALEGLTEEEVHTLNALLNKILTNLNRNS
ncbi:MarR family transcriptional regulator [Robertkochia marina]|uniref:MarR family transcriptional regulator n=1 Tax=Robertkochia marina TaxID=1227945 RepID=A0A4S3M0L9_9FLAO|nr:MarR family transcriptional regulator [Robertkochia marina]THD67891.1 MarR family transcriptional regulator [Robertkochia marina]TRZ42070.1 MarR family transcriptional regulator [Robertkochia marina]